MCVCVCVCTHILYLFIWMNTDCFHILVIRNNASVNIRVHIYFQISVFFSSDRYPGMELLDDIVFIFLIFEESLCCFK